jgi:hypothetical protein
MRTLQLLAWIVGLGFVGTLLWLYVIRTLLVLALMYIDDRLDVRWFHTSGIVEKFLSDGSAVFMPCTAEARQIIDRFCGEYPRWWLGGRVVPASESMRLNKEMRDNDVAPQAISVQIRL